MTDFTMLFDLERQLIDPAIRKNRTQLQALLASDFQEFGSSGGVHNREEVIDALMKESPTQITAGDFKAKYISVDAVLVTYVSIHSNNSRCLRSSIWKLADKQWQTIFHQGTKIY
jgi:hypothetical protein